MSVVQLLEKENKNLKKKKKKRENTCASVSFLRTPFLQNNARQLLLCILPRDSISEGKSNRQNQRRLDVWKRMVLRTNTNEKITFSYNKSTFAKQLSVSRS